MALVDGIHGRVDGCGWDALEPQLVGNLDTSPAIEGKAVLDKGTRISLLVEEALLHEGLQHLGGIASAEPPLVEFVANVGRRLLAAGA